MGLEAARPPNRSFCPPSPVLHEPTPFFGDRLSFGLAVGTRRASQIGMRTKAAAYTSCIQASCPHFLPIGVMLA